MAHVNSFSQAPRLAEPYSSDFELACCPSASWVCVIREPFLANFVAFGLSQESGTLVR